MPLGPTNDGTADTAWSHESRELMYQEGRGEKVTAKTGGVDECDMGVRAGVALSGFSHT